VQRLSGDLEQDFADMAGFSHIFMGLLGLRKGKIRSVTGRIWVPNSGQTSRNKASRMTRFCWGSRIRKRVAASINRLARTGAKFTSARKPFR